MIIVVNNPKIIDLETSGADGKLILRIDDGLFNNRLEFVFRDQKALDTFRLAIPEKIQPQKGATA